MNFLTRDKLEALTTPRLLAYRNRLLKVPTPDPHDPDQPVKGTTKELGWLITYTSVKEILATRPHVSRKKK